MSREGECSGTCKVKNKVILSPCLVKLNLINFQETLITNLLGQNGSSPIPPPQQRNGVLPTPYIVSRSYNAEWELSNWQPEELSSFGRLQLVFPKLERIPPPPSTLLPGCLLVSTLDFWEMFLCPRHHPPSQFWDCLWIMCFTKHHFLDPWANQIWHGFCFFARICVHL